MSTEAEQVLAEIKESGFVPAPSEETPATALELVTAIKKTGFDPTDPASFVDIPSSVPEQAPEPPHRISSLPEAAQQTSAGMLNLFLFPLDMIDASRSILGEETATRLGAPQRIGPRVRKPLQQIGMIPEKPFEGPLAFALELFGGSLPFGFGLLKMGQNVARSVPRSQQGMFQRSLVEASATPTAIATSTALDLSSSVGAALGAEAAKEFDLGIGGQVLLEMGGGFVHPLSILNSVGRRAGGAASNLFALGKGSDERRAARQIQRTVDTPQAGVVDPNAPLPATRQVGTERALRLEKAVLDSDPDLRAQFTDDLNEAIEVVAQRARGAGDPQAATDRIVGQRDYLLGLLEVRSAQAAQVAERQIMRLGPDADQRQIGRIVRAQADRAKKDARVTEKQVWAALDDNASIRNNADGTRNAVSGVEGRQSTIPGVADETLVPNYIRALLGDEASGKLTLIDLHTARSRVMNDMDLARTAGDARKANALATIGDALLEDLGTASTKGIEDAIAFSRELNNRFTKGTVGRLLSRSRGGGARIEEASTVQQLFESQDPVRAIRQLIDEGETGRIPGVDIGTELREFVGNNYFNDVLLRSDGKIKNIQKNHASFMRRMRNRGIFEVFPDLEDQFTTTRNAVMRDINARERLRLVKERGGSRLGRGSNIALANSVLDGNGEIALGAMLDADDPKKFAASLRRRMGNDIDAQQGLKAAFVDSLEARARDEFGNLDAKKYSSLIQKHAETGRALGMTADEIGRLRTVQETIQAAALKPTGTQGRIVEDAPGFVLELLARWSAGRAAVNVAGAGAGAQLQLANFFSKRARDTLHDAFRDGAEELLRSAVFDKQLFDALMTKPTASAAKQDAASRVIRAWLPGLAVTEIQEANE